MDLKALILEEHSKAQTDRIIRYVGEDKERFRELMNVFLQGKYRVSQRAAWPLSYCAIAHPEWLSSFFKPLMDMLDKPGVHDAVVRNIVRILQHVEIPEKYHGQLMSKCFDFISSPGKAVAIKAFSLTILENLSQRYPEISTELKLVIEERAEHETAAFHSRARKILRRMEKGSQGSDS